MKKTFIRYVSTNILGMIGLSCYILADTFFIANGLGADGLAALNLAISIFNFISATGLMIGIGGAIKYSICLAQNKKEKANITFTTSIKLGIVAGFLFLLIGIFASDPIATLLGANENTFSMTNTYLKTILSFAPFFIVNNIFIAFVRNDGNPKLSMIAMLTGSISNIILDYIFIFPLGWGMFGAAFATGLAPIISICILMKHVIDKKNRFHFVKSKINLNMIKSICSLGLSSFIGEFASGIILIIFNLIILKIAGNTGVAAYGIVANLALVATAIFTGVAQGTQPLLSLYYGKRNHELIKKTAKYGIYTSLGIVVVLYGFIILFRSQMVEIFNKDHITLLSETASYGLLIYFTGFFFAGLNILLSTLLSSIDKPKEAFTVSMLRGGVLIIPLAFILSTALQMTGVWISFPLSELLTLLVGTIVSRKILKNL